MCVNVDLQVVQAAGSVQQIEQAASTFFTIPISFHESRQKARYWGSGAGERVPIAAGHTERIAKLP